MNIITLREYSEQTDIPEAELKGRSRKRTFTIPRFVYWFYLNRSDPIKWSSVRIAEKFDRDHKSILHGIKQINNFIDTNDSIIKPYKESFIEPFLQSN